MLASQNNLANFSVKFESVIKAKQLLFIEKIVNYCFHIFPTTAVYFLNKIEVFIIKLYSSPCYSFLKFQSMHIFLSVLQSML